MSIDGRAPLVEPLTQREQDVLALLAQGKSNRELADALFLSINTVKWYNRQIFGKLGVANRDEAVARARALGLVADEKEHTFRPRELPAATVPLIGREVELEQMRTLLLEGNVRLITIVGAGGMGKTHLALEVGRKMTPFFADGVAFASLAALPAEKMAAARARGEAGDMWKSVGDLL